MINGESRQVESVVASPLSPHNKALYEAGKTLLVESIEVGREFCKFMIGSSSGAIPVYLGLLKFLLPEHYVLTSRQAVELGAPALVFLLASAVFAVGYFPTKTDVALELPEDINRIRNESVQRRRRFALWGFVIFGTACLWAIVASAVVITLPISGPRVP
jgi:hypothetical protein